MRPPGSVSYPVQASGQLHDAKLVPQGAGPSPIREQPPGASAHHKDREALQSISGAEYQLSSLDLLKPKTHFVLHSVAESCYRSCCGARLHFPCAASSFIHDSVEPNSLSVGEGQTQDSPQEHSPIDGQHLRRRVHTLLKCDASAAGPRGRRGGGGEERWGLAGHLRRLEGGQSDKDTMGTVSVCTFRNTHQSKCGTVLNVLVNRHHVGV